MLKKLSGNHSHSLGILALRLAVGFSFILHGLMKLQGFAGTLQFFAKLGLPAFVAYLVTVVELGGGIFIILGLFTEWVTLPIIIDMVCAIFLTGFHKGIEGGHELEILLLLGALTLAFLGSGTFSIDNYYSKQRGS